MPPVTLVFLIAGAITIGPFAASVHPFVFIAMMIAWAVGVFADARITRIFYQRYPNEFFRREKNAPFKRLVSRFGFDAALILFVIIIEVPIFVAVSFLLSMQMSGAFYASVGPAALALGITHMSAWRTNRAVCRDFHISAS